MDKEGKAKAEKEEKIAKAKVEKGGFPRRGDNFGKRNAKEFNENYTVHR
jgi:hypothetical protein